MIFVLIKIYLVLRNYSYTSIYILEKICALPCALMNEPVDLYKFRNIN